MLRLGTALAALSFLLLAACGGSDRPLTGPRLVTAQNSADPGIEHWQSNNGTSGPYFYVSFHEDRTGIINANHSASAVFVGNDENNTRQLLNMTWNEPLPGVIVITIAPGGWEVTLTNIQVAADGQSFSATVTGDLGDVIEMTFDLMPGVPTCC